MAIQNSFNMQLRAGITTLLGSDATGDIYYRDSNGLLTRLPIGIAGQLLTIASGLPSWANLSVGGDLSGTLPNPAVAARAITYAKIQAVATARLLGRNSAGSGDIEELDAATARALLGLGTAALVNTGTAQGNVPVLDANGQLATSIIPSFALSSIQVVANQAARLALSNVEVGDLAKQTDNGLTYMLSALPPSTDANWIPIGDTTIVASDITAGLIAPARLGSGTPSATTFLNGVQQWIALGNLATFNWNVVSGTSQAMAANNGYITSNAALTTFTLPSTAAVGTPLRIAGNGSGGWRIAQGAGQQIHLGNLSTAAGTGGRIDSLHFRDSLELVCVAANTTWLGVSSQGNLDLI